MVSEDRADVRGDDSWGWCECGEGRWGWVYAWLLRNAGVFWRVEFGLYDDMTIKEPCVNYLGLKWEGTVRCLWSSSRFRDVEYPSIIITKLVYYNYY